MNSNICLNNVCQILANIPNLEGFLTSTKSNMKPPSPIYQQLTDKMNVSANQKLLPLFNKVKSYLSSANNREDGSIDIFNPCERILKGEIVESDIIRLFYGLYAFNSDTFISMIPEGELKRNALEILAFLVVNPTEIKNLKWYREILYCPANFMSGHVQELFKRKISVHYKQEKHPTLKNRWGKPEFYCRIWVDSTAEDFEEIRQIINVRISHSKDVSDQRKAGCHITWLAKGLDVNKYKIDKKFNRLEGGFRNFEFREGFSRQNNCLTVSNRYMWHFNFIKVENVQALCGHRIDCKSTKSTKHLTDGEYVCITMQDTTHGVGQEKKPKTYWFFKPTAFFSLQQEEAGHMELEELLDWACEFSFYGDVLSSLEKENKLSFHS